jgi:hypothetical protein
MCSEESWHVKSVAERDGGATEGRKRERDKQASMGSALAFWRFFVGCSMYASAFCRCFCYVEH